MDRRRGVDPGEDERDPETGDRDRITAGSAPKRMTAGGARRIPAVAALFWVYLAATAGGIVLYSVIGLTGG